MYGPVIEFALITYMVMVGVEEEKKMLASKCKSATSLAKINDTKQLLGKHLTKFSQLQRFVGLLVVFIFIHKSKNNEVWFISTARLHDV